MENFAFMSLIAPDQAERDDYAARSKKILMHVMDAAIQGPADGAGDLRRPNFAVGDRSRGAGRAFGLTVDWIYPYLSGDEKQKIRTVFLRWCDENVHATVTSYNHPEPPDVFNEPILLKDKTAVRFAGNNYFTSHGRNLALMALALDPSDDPEGTLRKYLDNSTGAFLYMTDATLKDDAKGGIAPEGFEYGPLTTGYTMDLLFALHTSGMDDTGKRGPQVYWPNNPFWMEMIPGYIESQAPSLHDLEWPGPYRDYASFGDQETYEPYSGVQNDPILTLGPLGVLAREKGDNETYDHIRWIEENMPPGGNTSEQIISRSGSIYSPQNSIAYFMLMDPDSGPPVSPLEKQPLVYYAEGIKMLFGRTGWTQDDSYFMYQVTWTGIDHRHSDANNFGLHRKGEWITKEHTAYGGWATSLHNSMCIENDQPVQDDDISMKVWHTGSQEPYSAKEDGKMVAWSDGDAYLFALGDASQMYNSDSGHVFDVKEATRSIVWLKPDHVITYDRAETGKDGRFKRYYLQAPSDPQISGNTASATTKLGQKMFFTSLLPQGASIQSDEPPAESSSDGEYNAGGEPMHKRLWTESTDKVARFLNVVQGADADATADAATYVQGTGATPYDGVVVRGYLVAFPVDLDTTVDTLEFDVPEATVHFIITGLTAGAGYDVQLGAPEGGTVHVTIKPGGGKNADDAGVLLYTKP